MPGVHLKHPEFPYNACGAFTEKKERIEKFMQTENTDYIYKNDLDKACFRYDIVYGKYKDLTNRTQSDKAFRDKASEIGSNLEYDWYERGLALMVLG